MGRHWRRPRRGGTLLGCLRKFRYGDSEEARRAASRINKQDAGGLSPYHCAWCGAITSAIAAPRSGPEEDDMSDDELDTTERFWILDPRGHRNEERELAMAHRQMLADRHARWGLHAAEIHVFVPDDDEAMCDFCGADLPFDRPFPVYGTSGLCPNCAREIEPDASKWGSCCSCAACQAARRRMGV